MERIYVTVRARPLSLEESKTIPWRISGNSISIANQSTKFEFDRIFGEDCKTADVYEARTKEIVASAVRGFNGTIFAYGQTNSGKTYTMRGSVAELGIIPLAVLDLFKSIEEDMDREFLVCMSYMEIYNEEINDLLVPEHRKLQIHESLERGIYVAGLREEIVTSPEQVLDFMEFGESHRHIGETNMNTYSSRSHTIFRMIVESWEKNEDDNMDNSCDAVRVSVLNLVDLAGSERAAKTGAEGMCLKEGSHINKSLMTLGTVIKKLSEGAESQGGHVPYRDSKLTRILQPALGGNSNTAIICNITLAPVHTDETKSSLQFASRALRVTNCACVNEILTDAALLRRQRKEIEELRAKLLSSHSEHGEDEILNLRNTLLQSELEKERIALELEEEKKAKAHRERRLKAAGDETQGGPLLLDNLLGFRLGNPDPSLQVAAVLEEAESSAAQLVAQLSAQLQDARARLSTDFSGRLVGVDAKIEAFIQARMAEIRGEQASALADARKQAEESCRAAEDAQEEGRRAAKVARDLIEREKRRKLELEHEMVALRQEREAALSEVVATREAGLAEVKAVRAQAAADKKAALRELRGNYQVTLDETCAKLKAHYKRKLGKE